jgi:hypothetical protein
MIRRKLISTIAISVFLVTAASAVMAQGRYGNVYSRTDVDTFIQSLEASSDAFSRDFNSFGGASANERRIVERFENAVDRLRRQFNGNNSWWASRSQVQGIMTAARQVNVMMNSDRYARQLERQWRQLRRDINALARAYELQGIGGGGNGGGNWDDGGIDGPVGGGPIGQASRPPNWAIGTWHWTNGPRSFSIDANGIVTENAGGYVNQGTYNRGSIYLNGIRSTVTRTRNGIRTHNTANGEISDYTRSAYGGGGVYDDGGGYNNDGGWNNGGSAMTRPPNWALGTWRWVQGYGREFTIEASGRVVENIQGRISYGTYNNGVITLNGNPSTVTRTRDGIRTYNQSTGETSDYVRN